jgi:formamidopyrimidine-DNA glycosylase
MPELPEVEAFARALRRFVEGRTILKCRVIHAIAVRPSSGRGANQAAKSMERLVRGKRVHAVERRGKYLILQLEQGCLVLHFRLDGQLLWFDSRKTTGHVDVAFEMRHGTFGFADQRHFGRVQWAKSARDIPGVAALGIDPLSKEFTSALLVELLSKSSRPLKLFLLDQDKIAGIGNIYSNEAMWRARLDPRRAANTLSEAEARRLHKAIVGVLRRALECCLHPAPNLRDANWWFQGLEQIVRVYGREGKKCRKCGGPVERIEQGGRSTYLCVRCQR